MAANTSTSPSLARIAEALNLPITSFRSGAPASDLEAGGELVRLWMAIPSEADKLRLLALARELASKPVSCEEDLAVG